MKFLHGNAGRARNDLARRAAALGCDLVPGLHLVTSREGELPRRRGAGPSKRCEAAAIAPPHTACPSASRTITTSAVGHRSLSGTCLPKSIGPTSSRCSTAGRRSCVARMSVAAAAALAARMPFTTVADYVCSAAGNIYRRSVNYQGASLRRCWRSHRARGISLYEVFLHALRQMDSTAGSLTKCAHRFGAVGPMANSRALRPELPGLYAAASCRCSSSIQGVARTGFSQCREPAHPFVVHAAWRRERARHVSSRLLTSPLGEE